MKSGQQSETAAGVALARAMEQMRPPSERILEDPYSAEFVRGSLGRFVLSNRTISRLVERVFERILPGALVFVSVRGKYADDVVLAAHADGIRQYVVLGAGFDTAPLRLRPSLPGTEIFEVDHPATQASKRATLERIDPTASAAIHLVPVDFETDDLVERLVAAGFDREQRSVVIWMGVTYYLTEGALETTLDRLASIMPEGSVLAFDYVPPSVVDGTSESRAARLGTRRAARLGEPFLFGITPEGVTALLARHGFEAVDHLSPDGMVRRYVPPRRQVIDFAHFVEARRGGVGEIVHAAPAVAQRSLEPVGDWPQYRER